jgi:energy-coupling factor transporter ATP-binding protein EcfA2
MFKGRGDLIANLTVAINAREAVGKCFLIYGQQRSGKSSILHHLKLNLEQQTENIVVDLDNIGRVIDESSAIDFAWQVLAAILNQVRTTLDERCKAGNPPLPVKLPDSSQFFAHAAPLLYFNEVFGDVLAAMKHDPAWQECRFILLIDEFNYIYAQIVAGHIRETFMKTWKALLQRGYFRAVLVGQDVMPKFKARFANEFGVVHPERVTYLTPKHAEQLIVDPIRLQNEDSRYREQAVQRVMDLTAGSPFYIQIICHRLVEYMNRQRRPVVTEADVEHVVREELLRGANPLTEDQFNNLIDDGDTSAEAFEHAHIRAVLAAIARHSQGGACTRAWINPDGVPSELVDPILNDLKERDVVTRDRDNRYAIRVDLFRLWLNLND